MARAMMNRQIVLKTASTSRLTEVETTKICFGMWIFLINDSLFSNACMPCARQLENNVKGTSPENRKIANVLSGHLMIIENTMEVTTMVSSGFNSVQKKPSAVLL